MEPESTHEEMKALLQQNQELLEQNNKILRKMNRRSLWAFWVTALWYLFLLGLPFALYFYILGPYFEAFGSSIEVFNAGMKEIPGVKALDETIRMYQGQ